MSSACSTMHRIWRLNFSEQLSANEYRGIDEFCLFTHGPKKDEKFAKGVQMLLAPVAFKIYTSKVILLTKFTSMCRKDATITNIIIQVGRVKRIWYLSPMRAAKVQASLRIRTVSPEPSLLAHTSSESRGTFRQKARSLGPLNDWACAVKICHDGMLKDTNSLDRAQVIIARCNCFYVLTKVSQLPDEKERTFNRM